MACYEWYVSVRIWIRVVSTCQPQTVPIELPVVTSHRSVTPLESAWIWVGTSEQSWFDVKRKWAFILVNFPYSAK